MIFLKIENEMSDPFDIKRTLFIRSRQLIDVAQHFRNSSHQFQEANDSKKSKIAVLMSINVE
jgi:hypothetical protein